MNTISVATARQGERADVLAAVHYLTQLRGVNPRKVYVTGYAFGAAVALSALDQSEYVRGFIGVRVDLLLFVVHRRHLFLVFVLLLKSIDSRPFSFL